MTTTDQDQAPPAHAQDTVWLIKDQTWSRITDPMPWPREFCGTPQGLRADHGFRRDTTWSRKLPSMDVDVYTNEDAMLPYAYLCAIDAGRLHPYVVGRAPQGAGQ
jgi:hypothetical protein